MPEVISNNVIGNKIQQVKNSQPTLQSLFLMEFIRSIIRYKKSQKRFTSISHPVMDIQVPKISSSDVQKNVTVILSDQKKVSSDMPRVILAAPKLPMRKSPPANQIKPVDWSHVGLKAPPIFANTQQMISSINQIPIEKIRKILMDPSVFSVECSGSAKPLVIVSHGLSNITNTTLADEEINTLMQDISQKTRIPLIPGLFKAVFGTLLVIAVVSEFVGVRFVIQKRF